jgi:hypothetical protein
MRLLLPGSGHRGASDSHSTLPARKRGDAIGGDLERAAHLGRPDKNHKAENFLCWGTVASERVDLGDRDHSQFRRTLPSLQFTSATFLRPVSVVRVRMRTPAERHHTFRATVFGRN